MATRPVPVPKGFFEATTEISGPDAVRPVAVPEGFFEATREVDPSAGVPGDMGRMVGVGLNQLADSGGYVLEKMGMERAGRWVQEKAQQRIQDLYGELTPEQQAANQLQFTRKEDGEFGIGPAFTSPRALVGQVAASAPAMGFGMGLGGVVTRSLAAAGAGRAAAAGVGYGAGEGAVAGGLAGKDMVNEIRNAPIEALRGTEPFRLALESLSGDEGLSPENREALAREKVATAAYLETAGKVGLATAILSAPSGVMFDKMLRGAGLSRKAAAPSLVKDLPRYMAGEGLQEFPQEGAESIISGQSAEKYAGSAPKPWGDHFEQAVAGGVTGAVTGGMMGGPAHVAGAMARKSAAKAAEVPSDQAPSAETVLAPEVLPPAPAAPLLGLPAPAVTVTPDGTAVLPRQLDDMVNARLNAGGMSPEQIGASRRKLAGMEAPQVPVVPAKPAGALEKAATLAAPVPVVSEVVAPVSGNQWDRLERMAAQEAQPVDAGGVTDGVPEVREEVGGPAQEVPAVRGAGVAPRKVRVKAAEPGRITFDVDGAEVTLAAGPNQSRQEFTQAVQEVAGLPISQAFVRLRERFGQAADVPGAQTVAGPLAEAPAAPAVEAGPNIGSEGPNIGAEGPNIQEDVREPWEYRLDEFLQARPKEWGESKAEAFWRGIHSSSVKRAVKSGYPVDAEVLRDYADGNDGRGPNIAPNTGAKTEPKAAKVSWPREAQRAKKLGLELSRKQPDGSFTATRGGEVVFTAANLAEIPARLAEVGQERPVPAEERPVPAEPAEKPLAVGDVFELDGVDYRIDSLDGGKVEAVDEDSGAVESWPNLEAFERQTGRRVADRGTAVDAVAHEAATSPENDLPEPTQAQKEAGNYKKGHVKLHGLDISIENPKGSDRSGVDPDGKPWSVKMPAHYGYVKRTEGADGDHVDVYVGPNPESSRVFIVDQLDHETGKFDEHKIILGVDGLEQAASLYMAGFSDGLGGKRLGALTEMSVDGFKQWLKDGDTSRPLEETIRAESESGPVAKGSLATEPVATEAGYFNGKSAESGALWGKSAGLNLIKNPAGTFSFVGSVPHELKYYDTETGGPISDDLLRKINSSTNPAMVMKAHGVKSRIFKSAQAAILAAEERGHGVANKDQYQNVATSKPQAAVKAPEPVSTEAIASRLNLQPTGQKRGGAPVYSARRVDPSIRRTLAEMRREIAESEAGYKMGVDAGNGMGGTSETVVSPSSFPDYFRDKGYTKDVALKAIDNYLAGKGITSGKQGLGGQAATLVDLVAAKRRMDADRLRNERLRVIEERRAEAEMFAVDETAKAENLALAKELYAHLTDDEALAMLRGNMFAGLPKEMLQTLEENYADTDGFDGEAESDVAGRSARDVEDVGKPAEEEGGERPLLTERTEAGEQVKMFPTPSTFGKKPQKGEAVTSLDFTLPEEEAGLFDGEGSPKSKMTMAELDEALLSLARREQKKNESGFVYNRDLEELFKKELADSDPVVENRLPDIDLRNVDGAEARTLIRETEERIKSLPRGSWVVMIDGNEAYPLMQSWLMSDGRGKFALGSRTDTLTDRPATFANAYRRMVEGDAAWANTKAREDDFLAAQIEASKRLRPGMVIKGVRLNTGSKIEIFPTVTVSAVNEDGTVEAFATRAGRRGKFQLGGVDALALVKHLPDTESVKDADQLFAVQEKAAAIVAEKADTKPAAAEKRESSPQVIEDVGEKLGGAKKDRAALMAEANKEFSDDELASLPLSKVWPKESVDAIEDKTMAAIATAIRAEIPAKPRTSYKVKRWVEQVKGVRGLMRHATEMGRDEFLAKMDEKFSLKPLISKIKLLELIDREQWGRIGKVEEYPGAVTYKDGKGIPAPFVLAHIDEKYTPFPGETKIEDVAEKIGDILAGQAGEKRMQFEVRGRGDRFFINKVGDREYRPLKTFTDGKEAVAYKNAHYDELVQAWEDVKDRDNVKEKDLRRQENRPRTATDYRKGRDVSAEDFAATFGFRGVEFGNWVSQGKNAKERQGMVNQAYDALMDLAEIVGVPPKAISLNGGLGLGFGSRGSGWASAHFEPGTFVINLTKTRGAGALAHEWFHALDNYFSRQREGERTFNGDNNAYRDENFITHKPEPMFVHKQHPSKPIPQATLLAFREKNPASKFYNPENWHLDPKHPQGVRPVVERAFAELVEALNASPMSQRAQKIDAGKSDGYWSRTLERGARAFENYIIAKMAEKGFDNDYLANVVSIEEFSRDKGRYPYLLHEELAPVVEAFDNLFATIETKETDAGVAMYSLGGEGAEQDNGIFGEVVGPMAAPEAAGLSAAQVRQVLESEGLEAVEVAGEQSDNLRKIAEEFGHDVVFYQPVPDGGDRGVSAGREGRVYPNGFALTDRGANTIFLNAAGKYQTLFVLGHEIAHRLKVHRPESYRDLAGTLLDAADHRKLAAYMDRMAKISPELDDGALYDEFVANLVGEKFIGGRFWSELSDKNAGLLKRVAKVAREIIANIRRLFLDSPSATSVVRDLNRAERAIAEALGELAVGADDAAKFSVAPSTYLTGDSGLGEISVAPARVLPFLRNALEAENLEAVSVSGGNSDVLREVGKLFGKRIVFFRERDGGRAESGRGGRGEAPRSGRAVRHDATSNDLRRGTINGFMLPSRPEVIYLNVNAPDPLLRVLGHELGHSLRVEDAALWSDLVKGLQPLVRNWSDFKAAKGDARYANLSDDALAEELFGDVIGENFLNELFWRDMAQANEGLFKRVAKKAVALLSKALRALTGRAGVDRYVSDMTQARAVVAKVLSQYGERAALGQYERFAKQEDSDYLSGRIDGKALLARMMEMGHSLEDIGRLVEGTRYAAESATVESADAADVRFSVASTAQDRAKAQSAFAKTLTADRAGAVFKTLGSMLPERMKAAVGSVLSNPHYESRKSKWRGAAYELALERGANANEIKHEVMATDGDYEGLEGVRDHYRKASKAERAMIDKLLVEGDIRGEEYSVEDLWSRNNPLDGAVPQVVGEAYLAFRRTLDKSTKTMFDRLGRLRLLPYEGSEFYQELVDLLDTGMSKDDLRRRFGINEKAVEAYLRIRGDRKKLDEAVKPYRQQAWYDNLREVLEKGLTSLEVQNEFGGPGGSRDFMEAFREAKQKIGADGIATAERYKKAQWYSTLSDLLTQGDAHPMLKKLELYNAYQGVKEYDSQLAKLKDQWGQVKGYLPRIRKDGEQHVKVYRVSEDGTYVEVWMQPAKSVFGAKRLQAKVMKDLQGYIPHSFDPDAHYEVVVEPNTATPEEIFMGIGSHRAIEGLLSKVFDKATDAGLLENRLEVQNQVLRILADEISSRGFGRHKLHRAEHLIEGYETENTPAILAQFIGGMAGWLSKSEFAMRANKLMAEIPATRPEDKTWVREYVDDALKNSTWLDQWFGTWRSFAALMYLGFKASSAILNATQNYVWGQAVLSKHTGGATAKLLKAQADVLRDHLLTRAGKDGVLTEEERWVLEEGLRRGRSHANYVRAMSGLDDNGGVLGKGQAGIRWLTEKAMIPFQAVETYWNREPALLAAYRVFRAQGLEKEAALAKAEKFVDDVHFVVGKENIPGLLRKMGPAGRTLYTFQSYSHNYLLGMFHAMKDGEAAVVMRSLTALVLFGGLAAVPFGDDLDKWYRRVFGERPLRMLEKWLKETAGEYTDFGDQIADFVLHGAPALAGVNFSRALGVNVSFLSAEDDTLAERLGGVWVGLAQKVQFGAMAAAKGDAFRAAEFMAPEALANLMRSYRHYADGATTLSGRPVFADDGKQLRYTAGESVIRAFGFMPIRPSKQTEKRWDARSAREFWNSRKGDILAQWRRAPGDKEVLEQIRKFNRDLRDAPARPLVSAITPQTLRRALKDKPNRGEMLY
jgi:hypothetical protein